jgi:hypothetical protein
MIVNTFPIGDQQPTPKFVVNFYNDLRRFINSQAAEYQDAAETIDALLNQHSLTASISMQYVSFNEWEPDHQYPYIIFGWPTEIDQLRFLMHYNSYDVAADN